MMMTHSRYLLILALLSLLVFSSTATLLPASQQKEATATDVKEETSEAFETLKNYTVVQRDEAIAAAKNQLDRLDAKIEALQSDLNEDWQDMSKAAQQKKQATLKTLREKRNDVAEWFGGLQHSSAEAWEEVKTGFAKSYDQLQKTFSKASDEFKSEKGNK
jgi:hypothetical protein